MRSKKIINQQLYQKSMFASPHQRKELSDLVKEDPLLKRGMKKSTYQKRESLYYALLEGKENLMHKLESCQEELKHEVNPIYFKIGAICCSLSSATWFAFNQGVIPALIFLSSASALIGLTAFKKIGPQYYFQEREKTQKKLDAIEHADQYFMEVKRELEKIQSKLTRENVPQIKLGKVYREIRFINKYFNEKYRFLQSRMA